MASPVQLVTEGANTDVKVSSTNPLPVTLVTGTTDQDVNLVSVLGVAPDVNNGTVSAGSLRVTIASDSTGQIIALGNVAAGASDSGNPVKIGGLVAAATPASRTAGQRADLVTTTRGGLRVFPVGVATVSADALTANVTMFGRDDANAGENLPLGVLNYAYNGSTFDRLRGNTTGLFTVAKPTTTGGLTAARVVTETTGVIKASAGQLYTLSAANLNAAVRYLQLYNKATAPTLSTDTPVYTIPLAASGRLDINWTEIGLAFSTGIAWAYTTDDVAIPTTAGTSTELHFSASYA